MLPPLQMQDQPLPSGDDLKNGTNAVAARLAGMNASGTNAPTIPMVKLHDDPPAPAPSSTPPPLPPPPAPPVEAPAAPNAISNVMPPGAITPQMLIRFFEGKGDKHRSGGLAVPFLFTPPSPPGPSPSSTATYIKQ